jgi:tetratricopeptide (TPR) repeat protein
VALRANAAIDSHREAAQLYESFGLTDDCARLHFNLANSCCELSDLTGADRWQETVLHYEQSLRVRTRWADPERYTITLENLGTAYRRLPAADGSNLKNSIKCCRQAMHIYAAAAYPDKNASLPGIDARLIQADAWSQIERHRRNLDGGRSATPA